MQVTTWQKGLPFLPGYESETTSEILHQEEIPEGSLILVLEAKGQDYHFMCGEEGGELRTFYEHADGKLINPEEIGGMVGTMLGVFAASNGEKSSCWAEFDWIEMR